MRVACNNINARGITIDMGQFKSVYSKYQGLYATSCYKLYDLGYTTVPSIFRIKDFKRAFFDAFPDCVDLFRSNTKCTMDFSYKRAEYALCVLKSKSETDTDCIEVLTIFKDLLKSEEAISALTNLRYKLKASNKGVSTIKSGLCVTTKIHNKSNVLLDNFAVVECIQREADTALVKCDTRNLLIEGVCREIGLTDIEIKEHYKSGEGFFVRGISSSDERNFTSYIISGDVLLDGKYGNKLQEFIKKYYADNFGTLKAGQSCMSFEENVFIKTLQIRSEKVAEMRNLYSGVGCKDFYVTSDYVLFEIKTSVPPEQTPFLGASINVGTYALDWVTKQELSKLNNLKGLIGEYMPEEYVVEKGYKVTSLPVQLFVATRGTAGKLNIKPVNYYPIYNVVVDTDEFGNLVHPTPLLESTYNYFGYTLEEGLARTNCYSLDGLYNKLHNIAISNYDISVGGANNMPRRSYSYLVAELALAIIKADWGFATYTFRYNCYSFVNAEVYDMACFDAMNLASSVSF